MSPRCLSVFLALPLLAGCDPSRSASAPSGKSKPSLPPGVVWPDSPDQPPADPLGWQSHPLAFDVAGHHGDSVGTARVLCGGPPTRLRELLAAPGGRHKSGYRSLYGGPDTWVWVDGERGYQFSVGRATVFALEKPPPDVPLAVARERVKAFEIGSLDDNAEIGEYRPVIHRGRPGVDVTVSGGPYHIVARMVVDEANRLVYQAEVSVPRTAGRLRPDDPKVRAFLDGFEPPPPGTK
jgi:hypothetical protein